MFFQFLSDLPTDRTQQHIAPIVVAALIGAAAKGIGAAGSAISKKNAAKQAAAQAEKDRLSKIATDESMANPFRHSMDQMTTAQAFDQMANTTQKTVSIPGLNPKFMPKLGGGYQPSSEMRAAANLARTNTLAGQGQAPTMTDPANYGKTGAMDLIAMLQKAGLLPPGAVGGATTGQGMNESAYGSTALNPAIAARTRSPYGPGGGVEEDRFALSF